MFAVTAVEFTAEGTTSILVNRFIPSGDAHLLSYQTADSNSVHSLRKRSTNFWVYISSRQAPTTRAGTAASTAESPKRWFTSLHFILPSLPAYKRCRLGRVRMVFSWCRLTKLKLFTLRDVMHTEASDPVAKRLYRRLNTLNLIIGVVVQLTKHKIVRRRWREARTPARE